MAAAMMSTTTIATRMPPNAMGISLSYRFGYLRSVARR
jgi:hypothetical protein